MVIRTKDIANCPAAWTLRNDVEDAYRTGIHFYLYMQALSCFSHEINKIKQNKSQKQTTTNKKRSKKRTLTNELKT